MESIRFALFGRLRLVAARLDRPLRSATAAVLARLLLAEGQLVTVAELCAAMRPGWTGATGREDRVAVQKRVCELRGLLDPDNRGERSSVLLTDRGVTTAYRLMADRGQVDIFRFEDLARQALCASPSHAIEFAAQALALWADRPLCDFEDRDFSIGVVQRLWRTRDTIQRTLALSYQDTGQPAKALEVVNALLAQHRDDPELLRLAEQLSAAARRTAREAAAGIPAVGRGTASRVPQQLPLVVHGFTGRERELTSLNEVLAKVGHGQPSVLISVLSGPPGVGKSTLAVYWAHQVADRFPDGQLYVNLRGFGPDWPPMSVAEVTRRFLDALEVISDRTPADMATQLGLYRSLVAGRRVLILLDNAWNAAQVRPLLPGSPGCHVVVTSRNQLTGLAATEGAHLLTLDLLTSAEARQLLISRLGEDRVAAEPHAVDDIIACCSGLPLAIAVAAARAAARSRFRLAAIAAELNRPGIPAVLDFADQGVGVQAAFSWSYRQLAPVSARLFRLIGLHPGPDLTIPAAASLAAVPAAEIRPLLAELAAVNLLSEHLPGRYACNDLLRTYAADLALRLDDDAERRAAVHRLLSHYTHTACAADMLLDPHRDPICMAPLARGAVPENLSDAAEALAWFAAERAVLSAAVGHAACAGFDVHGWQLPWALSVFLSRQGHWLELAAVQQIALGAARRASDQAGQAHAHSGLGLAYGYLARYDEARSEFQRALDLFRQRSATVAQAQVHGRLAWVSERQGDNAGALGHSRQRLDLYRAAGHLAGQARALNSVGYDTAKLGDHRMALAYCTEALGLLQQIGDRYGEAHTWYSLGYVHRQLGQHEQAITCYGHAVDLHADLGDHFSRGSALIHLGDTHHAAGDTSAARGAWLRAFRILDDLGHPDADEVQARLHRLGFPPATSPGGQQNGSSRPLSPEAGAGLE